MASLALNMQNMLWSTFWSNLKAEVINVGLQNVEIDFVRKKLRVISRGGRGGDGAGGEGSPLVSKTCRFGLKYKKGLNCRFILRHLQF